MKVFLTNQTKLAVLAGVSPEHLSSVKSGKQGVSDSLASKLSKLTGIEMTTWASATRRAKLKKELSAFFKKERKAELEYCKEKASS